MLVKAANGVHKLGGKVLRLKLGLVLEPFKSEKAEDVALVRLVASSPDSTHPAPSPAVNDGGFVPGGPGFRDDWEWKVSVAGEMRGGGNTDRRA
jgi:hypothetical protein